MYLLISLILSLSVSQSPFMSLPSVCFLSASRCLCMYLCACAYAFACLSLFLSLFFFLCFFFFFLFFSLFLSFSVFLHVSGFWVRGHGDICPLDFAHNFIERKTYL